VRAGFGAARGRNLAVRSAVAQGLDRQEAFGGVLDLEGRVVDPKPGGERLFELAADPVAVLATLDEDVRREGGKA
jgi:hypothetical protein